MRRSVVQYLLGRKPFKPFRITVSTEETFDVSHPEAAYLAKRFMAVAKAPTDASADHAVQMVWIDYRHIVYCQPISKRDLPF